MFQFRRVYILIMVLIAVFAISVVSTATSVAQDEDGSLYNDTSIYEEDALTLDAQTYAAEYGVSFGEAEYRLKLQDEIGELNAELTEKERISFAGLWVQHAPEFRLVVQFTYDGEKTIQPYIEGKPFANIVEVRMVDTTLAELQATQNVAWLAVREVSIPLDYDINILENRVELYVIEPTDFSDALQKTNIQLPEHIEVIRVDGLSREVANIYAGLALSNSCTSGFSVKHSNGTKGVTTAGHCSNSQSYNSVNLPFQSGTWGGTYDVQWHTAPGFTMRNLAWDGTWNRYIYGEKHRNNQYVGQYVCKYGNSTGGGCGNITSTTFNGTYIRVHSDSADLAEPGDSGGPWFSGNTAYGLFTGDIEPGNDAYYMAINYIDILGLDVLTN